MKIKELRIKPIEIIGLILFIVIASFAVINIKDILKDKELSESVNIDTIVTEGNENKDTGILDNIFNPDSKTENEEVKIVVPGDAIAVVYVPSVGIKGKIKKGTDQETLKNYVGKFDGSVDPGQVGNFAIAAHNNVYTEIFRKLNKVKISDEVKIITREKEYIYKVKNIQTVEPDNVDVLKNGSKAEITLITCNNTASKRIVVKGELISQKDLT